MVVVVVLGVVVVVVEVVVVVVVVEVVIFAGLVVFGGTGVVVPFVILLESETVTVFDVSATEFDGMIGSAVVVSVRCNASLSASTSVMHSNVHIT